MTNTIDQAITTEVGWRQHWEIYDNEGPGVAKHIIGLTFEIWTQELDPLHDDIVWVVSNRPEPLDLADAMRAKLGPSAYGAWIAELRQQALTLWRERGHLDDITSGAAS
jgi:hypothetical protein